MEVSQTSIQCIDTYISYISRFFSTIPFFSPIFFVFEEEREPFLLESRFLRQVLRIWQWFVQSSGYPSFKKSKKRAELRLELLFGQSVRRKLSTRSCGKWLFGNRVKWRSSGSMVRTWRSWYTRLADWPLRNQFPRIWCQRGSIDRLSLLLGEDHPNHPEN